MFTQPRLTTATRTLAVLLALLAIALFAGGCGDDDSSSDDSSTDAAETESDDATESEAPDDSEDTGDTADTDDAASQTIDVGVQSGELRFDPDTLSAEAGTVTFNFTNEDSVPHDFIIEIDGERVDGTDLISDDSASITVELEPGTYEYYCSPHRSAGMTGTLTVT